MNYLQFQSARFNEHKRKFTEESGWDGLSKQRSVVAEVIGSQTSFHLSTAITSSMYSGIFSDAPGPDPQTILGQTCDISYDNILWPIHRTLMAILRQIKIKSYDHLLVVLGHWRYCKKIANKQIKIAYKQTAAGITYTLTSLIIPGSQQTTM